MKWPEWNVLSDFASLTLTNPFGKERLQIESRLVGKKRTTYWNRPLDWNTDDPLAEALLRRLETELQKADSLSDVMTSSQKEIVGRAQLYRLYYAFEHKFYEQIVGEGRGNFRFYVDFREDWLKIRNVWLLPDWAQHPDHLFALFFQLARAFHYIYHRILGQSPVQAALRGRVWESIFSYDSERYLEMLVDKMQDMATIILGPSGSGKELVASAIAMGSYWPFDAQNMVFATWGSQCFVPLHIAALSESLVESELFGHCKGAFTGAVADRQGYLEGKSGWDTIFLDEVAEIAPSTQTKLLRVLQNRQFSRVGEQASRYFGGRIIAATHKNLDTLIAQGTFREDLYYRLQSNVVETPALAEILRADADELQNIVALMLQRMLGENGIPLVENTVDRIRKSVGSEYHWPGNMRELEQALRSVLLHGSVRPRSLNPVPQPIVATVANNIPTQTLEEVVRQHILSTYKSCGTLSETARVLGIDRRTVAKYI